MWKNDEYYLERAIAISEKARQDGNTPFGCILVDGDGNVILEQGNVEITEHRCTGHAETVIMERASELYEKDFLWKCTLYTTCEPCPMCAGAVYWGNVGRVVYAMTEKRLLSMTGNHQQNPTFTMTCEEVFAKGQKKIKVEGPYDRLAEKAVKVHMGYWD